MRLDKNKINFYVFNFNFYISPLFQQFLNKIGKDLSFEEYMLIDFIPGDKDDNSLLPINSMASFSNDENEKGVTTPSLNTTPFCYDIDCRCAA